MKTKNIFKTLVLAAVLVSACGKNEIADDFKGYTLPVTINVTRQGDEPATRASYNESTRKLEFSAGDKLFVEGQDNNTAGSFKGVLTWVSGGTFSGSINTQHEYTGTADALLTDAAYVSATLLPAGYESYAFLSIEDETDCYGWVSTDFSKAFALTKKAAVEQFSYEYTYTSSYSSGFALAPQTAILSFTISGLAANKEVAVLFEANGSGATPVNVTTDASGVATFAVAVESDYIDNNTLTVDGIDITLPDKTAEKGHIYNISRSVAPATPTLTLTSPTVGQVIGSDGKNYAYGSLPTGVTAVAKICYVSGSNGLALALTDEGQMNWSTAQTTCAAHTPAITGGTWKLATKDEWDNMISAAGSYSDLRDGFSSVGGTNMGEEYYWSSTEFSSDQARDYDFCDGEWSLGNKEATADYVRACLAF
jgi:hypothetical protein